MLVFKHSPCFLRVDGSGSGLSPASAQVLQSLYCSWGFRCFEDLLEADSGGGQVLLGETITWVYYLLCLELGSCVFVEG